MTVSAQPAEGDNAWAPLAEMLKRFDDAETAVQALMPRDEAAYDLPDDYGFLHMRHGPMHLDVWKPHVEALEAMRADGTFARLDEIVDMPRCVRPAPAP